MKLFLSSVGIPDGYANKFMNLVGGYAQDVRIAHVIDAAMVYPKDKRGFIDTQRDSFRSNRLSYRDFEIMNTKNLKQVFSEYNVIWLGGGNVFYLRYVLRKSGLDEILPELMSQGLIYAGSSAGAVIAGPTLKYLGLLDDESKTPEVIYEGLGIVDFVSLPHWGNAKYDVRLKKLQSKLINDGFNTKTISDDEAIVIKR